MVTAIVRDQRVTLEQGEWAGATPGLLEKLEAATADGIQTVSGADPSPELTVANAVADNLGGRVLQYRPEVDTTTGRIY